MVRQLLLSLMVARKNNPDDTHQRRGHTIHPVVSFTSETYLSGKKEELLPRDTNKQRLIPMISDGLVKENVLWLANRSGDAYLVIVKMTVETSLQHTTTLI